MKKLCLLLSTEVGRPDALDAVKSQCSNFKLYPLRHWQPMDDYSVQCASIKCQPQCREHLPKWDITQSPRSFSPRHTYFKILCKSLHNIFQEMLLSNIYQSQSKWMRETRVSYRYNCQLPSTVKCETETNQTLGGGKSNHFSQQLPTDKSTHGTVDKITIIHHAPRGNFMNFTATVTSLKDNWQWKRQENWSLNKSKNSDFNPPVSICQKSLSTNMKLN